MNQQAAVQRLHGRGQPLLRAPPRRAHQHRAPFVGFLFCRFHPAEAPHSAPCAQALERAADLSFSYIHSSNSFTRQFPLDARDGRVMLGACTSAPPLHRRGGVQRRRPEEWGAGTQR